MRFVLLVLVLLLMPSVYAQSGHMKLLAVSNGEEQIGGIADLFLEIKPGSGRVFLETFPLTRVDTQISTRFAKQIACDYADVNCDRYDFFYTITSDSSIIAGPSAGAAISVLTFSLIANEPISNKVAVTGTINSGGLIGPVGGVAAKVEAASRSGIKKVLVPFGELSNFNTSNETMEEVNAAELEQKYGIKVIEVSTIDEALHEFTGKRFREQQNNLTIDDSYQDTMKSLAIELCSRSTRLKNQIEDIVFEDRDRKERAINLSDTGKEAFDSSLYYSAASFCFGSNVALNSLLLESEELSQKEIDEKINELRWQIESFDREIEATARQTITDLESYMIVKERLKEAEEFLDIIEEDESNATIGNLAYATERVNSAYSWAQFLQNTGRKFDLDTRTVRDACRVKLAEVEERLQYVQLYFPRDLESTKTELQYAYDDFHNQDYELCLFKASKAKASVDTLLSVFGVQVDSVERVVEQKLNIVERNLVEETEKGVFPVLGYSYFEYANSLKETDVFSSLLYASYALELSNLDIYFEEEAEKTPLKVPAVDSRLLLVLMLGILIGIAVTNIFYLQKQKHKTPAKLRGASPGKKR